MERKALARLGNRAVSGKAVPPSVYFYETGWISPRRLVAVGSLDKVWFSVPEDTTAEELSESFRSFFGAEWDDVLDATEKSFAYNAANDAYFAVRNLRTLENVTLEQLLEIKELSRPPNIIVS
jgi:hypothetical protein